MSDISLEEEKEEIIFNYLNIIDMYESESELDDAMCEYNINNNKKKFSIKIKNNKISEESKSQKSKKEIKIPEEIHEVKYNLFLALTKNFKPTTETFNGFLVDKYFKAKRLMIQEFEISEGKINYGPKKYAFISLEENPTFLLEKDVKIELIISNISGEKEVKMKLGEEFLMTEKEFIEKFYGQKVYNENFIFNKNIEIKDNKSLSSNSSQNSSTFSKNDSKKSKKSKKDSSENEGETGNIFYQEKEKENTFVKYSYYPDFIKEVDGIYIQHDAINLNIGKIEINNEKYLNDVFTNLLTKYNSDNDLQGHIIMKNFKKESIPANTQLF